MFLRKAALRPVPSFARVGDHAIESLESQLEADDDNLQAVLDDGYRAMERHQPCLSEWLSQELAGRSDELAQSVGYFLAVAVYIAFREAFPRRLLPVESGELNVARETLQADEELRAEDPSEVLDSDDVVALGQPQVLEFVQHHLEEALRQSGDDADLDELDQVYRAILIEVIALSHAVQAPEGQSSREAPPQLS